MKRIIICALMLALAITASVYSGVKVTRVYGEMTARIESILKILPEKDRDELVKQATELSDYWRGQEKVLVHFTRHSNLDHITTSTARLPYLAAHDDHAELGAELSSIRRQIEHLRNSETPSLENLM